MKIVLIENSNIEYDGNDRNNPILRGAELAIINYSEELVKRNHDVTVINNCKSDNIINGVRYHNFKSKNFNRNFDIAIVNADAKLFNIVRSRKNFVLSHSIQNFEKFIRNNQLISFFKFKPIVLCFSNYHYKNRSLFTSFYGKKILIPSIDIDYYNTKISSDIKKDIIFYSRADRNSKIVIKIWKELFTKFQIKNKLYVSSDIDINDDYLNKFNIYKKPFLDKTDHINFLKNFRISIIPGHKGEVYCNVAEESKALGIPILTLGIGALKERVDNDFNGYLCKDEEDLTSKLYNLISNDEDYLRLKKNLLLNRGNYTWSNTVENLCKLFN